MGMKWNSNADEMFALIELRLKEMPQDVAEAVTRSTIEGADRMQNIIIASETNTGRKRAARGGGAPGRVKTGDMFNDVKTETKVEGNNVTGRLGWIYRPQDYYAKQDNTEFSISGVMHALLQGFTFGREALVGRMAQIARNGKLDR